MAALFAASLLLVWASLVSHTAWHCQRGHRRRCICVATPPARDGSPVSVPRETNSLHPAAARVRIVGTCATNRFAGQTAKFFDEEFPVAVLLRFLAGVTLV